MLQTVKTALERLLLKEEKTLERQQKACQATEDMVKVIKQQLQEGKDNAPTQENVSKK